MSMITVDTKNSTPVELYYEDHGRGSGRPHPRIATIAQFEDGVRGDRLAFLDVFSKEFFSAGTL